MNKLKNFEKEIGYIKNIDIKEDLINMIELIPDYFFIIPASTTGKYHPTFSLGEGGLLRHTKFAVRIAHDLLSLEMFGEMFNERQKDKIIYALIMHDTFKCGKVMNQYTKFEHPLIAAEEVLKNSTLKDKDEIASMIKSHMGQWNEDKYSKAVLPKPKTECEKFVHMCDCLSSKKYLDSKFNGNEIEENVWEGSYVRS